MLACSAGLTRLENAGTQYRQVKDFTSLEIIHGDLFKGMPGKELEGLLGEPDYSPTDGQYYYLSSRTVYSDDHQREVSVGLLVDYRDSMGSIKKTLQNFWLGPLGE